jgi:hypothetical protein
MGLLRQRGYPPPPTRNASVVSKGVIAQKCAIRALLVRSRSAQWLWATDESPVPQWEEFIYTLHVYVSPVIRLIVH